MRDFWVRSARRMASPRDKLDELDRDELLALARRMLDRDPNVAAVIESPCAGRGRAVRAEDVDRQVELALRPAFRGGWRESLAAAQVIEEIAAWGATFVDAGEIENAIVVFEALSAGIRARYGHFHDEESEIGRVLDECVDQLEACLDRAIGDPRQRALDALLDLAVWDATCGGYGIGERSREVVIERTTKEERQRLAARAEPAFASVTSSSSRQSLGSLVVALRGDVLDDEVQSEHERIDRLLRLHRVEEARAALASVDGWRQLVDGADVFLRHGYASEAERVLTDIVEARRSTGRWIALDWLCRHAEPERTYPLRHRSVGWPEELFWEQPTVENWMRLRAASKESRRVQIRHRLADEGRYLLLVEILAAENRHREALAKFARVKERDERALQVAEKIADGVASKKPRDAAALYAAAADAHCERDRPNEYEIATELIVRGREALARAGHSVLAKRYVDHFRKRHARRQSLIEMLDRALSGSP